MEVRESASSPAEVKLSRIDLADSSFNFRRRLSLNAMIDSIQRHGQVVPVLLRHRPHRRLQIVCGFRRVLAAVEAGRSTVQAVIRRDLDERAAFELSLVENEQRKSLSDVELGYALVEYRTRYDASIADLMQRFGMARQKVFRLKRLTGFPEILQSAIHDGVVATTTGLVLMEELGGGLDEDVVAYWVDRIIEDGLSPADVRREVRRLQTNRAQGRRAWVHLTDHSGSEAVVRLRPVKLDFGNMPCEEAAEWLGQFEWVTDRLRERTQRCAPVRAESNVIPIRRHR